LGEAALDQLPAGARSSQGAWKVGVEVLESGQGEIGFGRPAAREGCDDGACPDEVL